jgi:hypothetical protein
MLRRRSAVDRLPPSTYNNGKKMAACHFPGSRHGGLNVCRVFLLCHCSALKEVNDDRNHRKQQQQVNQRTGNVKYQKPAEP